MKKYLIAFAVVFLIPVSAFASVGMCPPVVNQSHSSGGPCYFFIQMSKQCPADIGEKWRDLGYREQIAGQWRVFMCNQYGAFCAKAK